MNVSQLDLVHKNVKTCLQGGADKGHVYRLCSIVETFTEG